MFLWLLDRRTIFAKWLHDRSCRGTALFAFDRLALHRIEAACLPSNKASQGVLKKAGFSYEGLARKYLKINGEWQDHMVFSLIREELLG